MSAGENRRAASSTGASVVLSMWATLLEARDPTSPWCVATAENAGTSVTVLSHLALDGGVVVEEALVSDPRWDDRLASIARHPSVRSIVPLEPGVDRARVRAEVSAWSLDRAVARSGLGPRFPFDVRDGWARFLVVAPIEQVAVFVGALRAEGIEVRVSSSREHRPLEGLTDRQRELLHAAVAQGYFEVPRHVTLTELARRLHVAKSTLSETLARGERRLIEQIRSS